MKAARVYPQEYLRQAKGIGSALHAPVALGIPECAALFQALPEDRGLRNYLGLPERLGSGALALRIKLADDAPLSQILPGLPFQIYWDGPDSPPSPGLLAAFDAESGTGTGWSQPPSGGAPPREGSLFNVSLTLSRVAKACLVPREGLRGSAAARVLRIYDPRNRTIRDMPVSVLGGSGGAMSVSPAPDPAVYALMTPQKPGVLEGDQVVEPVDPLALQAGSHWSEWIRDWDRQAEGETKEEHR